MMDMAVDTALTDRVAQLIREIEQVEAARPPVEAEVAVEITKLETAAARSDASLSLWLSANPAFGPGVFETSLLGVLMAIDPEKVRRLVTNRARQRAAAWHGLRLTETEKQRRLIKLQGDLRTARARVERKRREIEEVTGQMLPRVNDDPSVWLLVPDALNALAAAGNGRTK